MDGILASLKGRKRESSMSDVESKGSGKRGQGETKKVFLYSHSMGSKGKRRE